MGTPYETRVTRGRRVAPGECLAASDVTSLHAPLSGQVAAIEDDALVLECRGDEKWPDGAAGTCPARGDFEDYPPFLAAIGLMGMGGSLFPASVKLRLSKAVDTLVVNGAECEPGVTIDRALLVADHELVRAGAEATAEAVGASRIVLAIRRETRLRLSASPRQGQAALGRRLRDLYPFDVLELPNVYPAGAEKLILRRLTGRMPAVGELPFHFGCVVQNVASLRAVGRAVRDRVPVIERPLSLVTVATGETRNLLVPVGMPFGDVLTAGGQGFDSQTQMLVAGGLMMGRLVRPEDPVTKGTNSLFVLPNADFSAKERSCIRCGACCDACPLGLHPALMVEALQGEGSLPRDVRAQLDECFLCGACSSVCPSHIPLASRIRTRRGGPS